jgi:hypothetical protein
LVSSHQAAHVAPITGKKTTGSLVRFFLTSSSGHSSGKFTVSQLGTFNPYQNISKAIVIVDSFQKMADDKDCFNLFQYLEVS